VRATLIGVCAITFIAANPIVAQERLRISANIGQQASTTTVSQEQSFDRYFEQGSFTFEREIPQSVIFDFGAMVRVWRGLYAGGALSIFDQTGAGTVTARVPHPLQFNKPRTTAGEIADANRREFGQHITVGWAIPASGGLDFILSGGPSFFNTQQLFVTRLNFSLQDEVFPFEELAFPRADTEIQRENAIGYNAGVDMTWRLNKRIGLGLLVRYSAGKKEFIPTGALPVEVTAGGLHAGGGVRVLFNSFGSKRKPVPPPRPPAKPQPKPPPPKPPPPK
jgi:hypothetical protein